MSVLTVTHLKKIYTSGFGGNQVEALRDVCFSVEDGECSNEQLYQKISDTLTMLQATPETELRRGGEVR